MDWSEGGLRWHRVAIWDARPGLVQATGLDTAELEYLEQLGCGGATTELSPAGLARAVAIGWGGSADRDVRAARAARAHVRAMDALSDALDETGLRTAPRLMTVSRMERVLRAFDIEGVLNAAELRLALAE